MLLSLLVQSQIRSSHCIFCQFFHFRKDFAKKYIFLFFAFDLFIEICLKFFIWDLVAFFIFAVLIRFLLNSIICEMNKRVTLFKIELSRWCSDVSFRIPISFDCTIETSKKKIMSDIKFSVFVEQRFLYILLKNKSS